jgi:hypothetical protein
MVLCSEEVVREVLLRTVYYVLYFLAREFVLSSLALICLVSGEIDTWVARG